MLLDPFCYSLSISHMHVNLAVGHCDDNISFVIPYCITLVIFIIPAPYSFESIFDILLIGIFQVPSFPEIPTNLKFNLWLIITKR